MRDKFQGFYQPNDEEIKAAWEDKGTLFVFDTSTLLNIYSYAEQTRTDFFSILEKLQDQIWLPYHVGLEYQRRRLEVIKEEKNIFLKIHDCLKKIEKVFESDFKKLSLKKRFPGLYKETKDLHQKIALAIDSYSDRVKEWDSKQPCVRSHDVIRERLTTLFAGKVGPIPSQAWLDKIYEEGKQRFENKVPPGYMDYEPKKDISFSYAGLLYKSAFSDLIIWKQIIQEATKEGIKAVIFITDDGKEDWLYIINSRGKKKIGPRAELREEIYREASVNFFIIYNTADFLEAGRSILEVAVQESSIQDANTIFQRNLVELYNERLGRQIQNEWSNYLTNLSATNLDKFKLDDKLRAKLDEYLHQTNKIDFEKIWINFLNNYKVQLDNDLKNYILHKEINLRNDDDNDDSDENE